MTYNEIKWKSASASTSASLGLGYIIEQVTYRPDRLTHQEAEEEAKNNILECSLKSVMCIVECQLLVDGGNSSIL